MATSNPLRLSGSTRFRPTSFRGHTRTPSRSPVRKSLFLAKEVDPFLSNLSPESTLRALQATSTIAEGGVGQDILAQSIADASPEEREIGIRAALTAQKLKQWRHELEHWPWPSTRDRRSGAGFLLPRRPSVPSLAVLNDTHAGYLPSASIQEYQDKIEDIRDGIEAFELEDIKDHIFSAHTPQPPRAGLEETSGVQTSFGRMRDFTALVTATVVQALPDMVHVNMLLDTWDIRLSILRQIPSIQTAFRAIRSGLETARSLIRDDRATSRINARELETTKALLGDKVSTLGSKIDTLLDLLEGQEDTLPKSWIDSLEDIENDYAAWIIEAEHVVARNNLGLKTLTKQPSIQIHGPDHHHIQDTAANPTAPTSRFETTPNSWLDVDDAHEDNGPIGDLPDRELFTFPLSKKPLESSFHSRKPSLNIKPNVYGHKRAISEISVAESALSGLSDLSNAEIVDARSTQLLASPKISMVDNAFRNSGVASSWYQPDARVDASPKPPVLHRASTTSIHVVSKDSVRPVTVIRSQSLDLLNTIQTSRPSTPSRALLQLTGMDSPALPSDYEDAYNGVVQGSPSRRRKSSMSRHPSLMVEPLLVRPKDEPAVPALPALSVVRTVPAVPRRSSRRFVRTPSADSVLSSSSSSASPVTIPHTPTNAFDRTPDKTNTTSPSSRSMSDRKSVSLEEKIKDILSTMPTTIRLARGVDDNDVDRQRSAPSTRPTTPAPALTLSPVKADRANRKTAAGDVRVFHLTRAGQNKDAAPVKLFVRAVGENGERVMVRVGGGWADLAEYLREYSLHHGHRGLIHDQLEVASLPSSSTAHQGPSAVTAPVQDDTHEAHRSAEQPRRSFSLSGLSGLAIGRSRKSARNKSLNPEELADSDSNAPPPVPHIPSTYNTLQSPTVSSETRSASRLGSTLYSGTSLATSTSSLSPNGGNGISYTPLGAAGPKSNSINSRRTASYNTLTTGNEVWVESMLGKGRAVSNSTIRSSKVTVTTTTNSSTSSNSNKLRPANSSIQADESLRSPISSNSGHGLRSSPVRGPAPPPAGPTVSRSKTRMSLSDVGNIKRVFLRRKSEKV